MKTRSTLFKSFKPLVASLALLLCPAALTSAQQHYTLTFTPTPQAYNGSTNITIDVGTYYFYSSTNATIPLSQWPLFGSAPVSYVIPQSSNYVVTTNFGNFTTSNQVIFFSAVVSNSQGVAPFSNIAGLIGAMSGGRFLTVTSP